MKKIIILMMFFLFSSTVNASQIVVDMDTNRVLYGDYENKEMLIASTTKIMTSLVVLNNVDNLKEIITVDENVLKSYGSNIYIEVGEKISIEDLLYGLMLRSGNDAALVLAEYVGGSQEGFAKLMNETAASIGMKNTYFINSSGLENELGEGNTSTAYDLALLMSSAMQNETFRTITQTKEKVVKTNYKTYKWTNKNKLLFSYQFTTGGKTGYTKKSYRTLVTSATKENKNLIVVTLNQANDFLVHKSLYEEYFNKYDKYKIIDSTTFLKDKNYYIENDISMLLTEDEYKRIKTDVTITNDALNRIGYVTVSLDDKIYFKENIYALKEEHKTLLDKIKDFFYNLFK